MEEGTCPDCGESGYCSCYTDFECRCNSGFTEVNGSCEGKIQDSDNITLATIFGFLIGVSTYWLFFYTSSNLP